MRILADENVEQMVIERLRSDGYDVISVRLESRGATDLPIPARAVNEDLLLLTADLDFGEYVFRDHLPAPNAGVVQYRLGDVLKENEKARIIGEAFIQFLFPLLETSVLSRRTTFAFARYLTQAHRRASPSRGHLEA